MIKDVISEEMIENDAYVTFYQREGETKMQAWLRFCNEILATQSLLSVE